MFLDQSHQRRKRKSMKNFQRNILENFCFFAAFKQTYQRFEKIQTFKTAICDQRGIGKLLGKSKSDRIFDGKIVKIIPDDFERLFGRISWLNTTQKLRTHFTFDEQIKFISLFWSLSALTFLQEKYEMFLLFRH